MPVEIGDMICEEKDKTEEREQRSASLSTCPVDPRFQQMNKTKWCYTMFIDFHRCVYLLGDGNENCKIFEKCYKSLCPNEWIQNWNDQIERGNFPRDLTKEMGR